MQDIKKYNSLLKIYLHQINEDFEKSAERLEKLRPSTKEDTFFNIATWVWLYNRHNLNSDSTSMMSVQGIDDMVKHISSSWRSSHRAVTHHQEDIYLSNLSMVYAALIEAKNALDKAELQKDITEVRDYVFDNMLSGGMVLGSYKNREVSVDQVLSVLPYGLFSPEDLVMVEAVYRIKEVLETSSGFAMNRYDLSASKTATLIMSLYYLEKSEKETADYYYNLALNSADTDENMNSKVLSDIYHVFAEEEAETGSSIVHEPYGNDNVYSPKLTERKPHFPLMGESMEVPCQIISQETIKECNLHISDNVSNWTAKWKMHKKTEKYNNFFTVRISDLPKVSTYTYYFKAVTVSGEEIVSDFYEIKNLEKLEVLNLKTVQQSQRHYLIDLNLDINTRYLFVETTENKLKMSFVESGGLNDSQCEAIETRNNKAEKNRIKIAAEKSKFRIFNDEKIILESHELFPPIEIIRDCDNNIFRFQFNWHSPQSQEFYGFGERYNSLNQRGNTLDCYVYNQYRDQGTKTYIPVPFYLTNSDYGVYVETNLYTKFDVCSEIKDRCTWFIDHENTEEDSGIHLFVGNYKEQIRSYTEMTGKPEMIPAWALGPWMSSNNWDRQSIVKNEVELTKKHNIPSTVLVLEQWSDETTYYMFNDALYKLKDPRMPHTYEEMTFPDWGRWPDPKGMVDYLHDNDLKLILWQIPISKYLNKQSHPLKDLDEKHMIENGYIVRNEDDTPFRIPENWFTNSLILDFSNKEAVSWWFSKRQYLLDIGIDGFKTDGGEFVFGNKLKFSDGKTGKEMRNKYPNDYIEAYYKFAQKNHGITFSRAGYTGAQNFPAHWAGDERSTFAAFKRSLIAGINAGMSGITFWGWDLAGFNGDIPSAELYKRSSSMAAFCPIMQYHAESKAEFNQDRTPWNIAERTDDPDVIRVYRYFANVRMNLMPYIYQEAEKSAESGIPLMRALMIEFPDDLRLAGIYDEYLFGDSLLVAPVVEEGEIDRKVYLPEGKWFDFWNDEISFGPRLVNVQAEVNEIPVYVRSNSAILMNVDKTKQLGSGVGNALKGYVQPLCKIYYESNFNTVVYDHLDNKLELFIYEEDDRLCVDYTGHLDDLEIQVTGTEKTVEINKF